MMRIRGSPQCLLWTFAGFLLRLDRDARRLAGYRDRPAAVARHRRAADGGCGGAASGAQLGASLTGYILTYGLMLVAYMVVLTHLAGKAAVLSPACRGNGTRSAA